MAVATLSGNSLRQIVHTYRASVHQAAKLVAALLRVAGVTAGLPDYRECVRVRDFFISNSKILLYGCRRVATGDNSRQHGDSSVRGWSADVAVKCK